MRVCPLQRQRQAPRRIFLHPESLAQVLQRAFHERAFSNDTLRSPPHLGTLKQDIRFSVQLFAWWFLGLQKLANLSVGSGGAKCYHSRGGGLHLIAICLPSKGRDPINETIGCMQLSVCAPPSDTRQAVCATPFMEMSVLSKLKLYLAWSIISVCMVSAARVASGM